MDEMLLGIKFNKHWIYSFTGFSGIIISMIVLLIFVVTIVFDMGLMLNILGLFAFLFWVFITIMSFEIPELYCLKLYEEGLILKLTYFLPVIKMSYDNIKKLKVTKKIIYFITKKDKKIGIKRTAIKEEDLKRLIEFLGKYCEIEIV